ncbi:MAG TPA: hypothetical protein VMJ65_09890 [Solirubrobacteraceae bacterium]|nr:hypothetical protein [Solirubrobacteraceae bacterium]
MVDRVPRRRRPVGGRRRSEHASGVTVDGFDQQTVLAQRPRLVGEQHGHRADGLGGAQPPQQDTLPGQAQTAERDQHRHEDRQLLGDRGERERQPVEKHLAWGAAAKHPEQGHEYARRYRHDQRCARQLGHRALKGGRRFLGLCDQPAEASDLCLVTYRHNDALAGAGHDCRARVQHRGPLGQRRVGVHRLGFLRGGDGLAGEPGLVGGQTVGLNDTGVGRDDGAGLDQQHIADDERVDRDRHGDAGAPHESVRALRSRSACSARSARTSEIASTALTSTMTEKIAIASRSSPKTAESTPTTTSSS